MVGNCWCTCNPKFFSLTLQRMTHTYIWKLQAREGQRACHTAPNYCGHHKCEKGYHQVQARFFGFGWGVSLRKSLDQTDLYHTACPHFSDLCTSCPSWPI